MKAKTITLLFSLKNQNLKQIITELEIIAKHEAVRENHTLIIHGHLPYQEIKKTGRSMELHTALERLFPLRITLWDKETLHAKIAQFSEQLDSKVYAIGQVLTGGIATDIKEHKKRGLKIEYVPLAR